VAERGCLPGARGERESRSSLGGGLVPERDEHREAVEPRPVQVTEGGRQRGVVVLRRHRLIRGRRTPPWHVGLTSDCTVYSPWANCPFGAPSRRAKLDFVVKYRHSS
jgi:hypothetical protein